jgi:hypothetical protein
MAINEVEQVLSNWIREAYSESGSFPQDTDREKWVVSQFASWWKNRAGETLSDAELAARKMHDELIRLGDWESFGEVLHEHCHLRDALTELRTLLGLENS